MKNNTTHQDQIDRYLLNRMEEAEKIAFEKEMAVDPELKKQFLFTQTVQSVARMQENQKQRVRLQQAKEDFLQGKQKKQAQKWMISAVASLALLVGVSLAWILDRPQSSSANNPFMSEYEEQFNPAQIVNRSGENPESWEIAFRQQQYEQVIQLLESAGPIDALGTLSQKALVIAYLELHYYDEAIASLEILSQPGKSDDSDLFRLKLALVYQRKSQVILEEIHQTPDYPYRKKADSLYHFFRPEAAD